MQNIKRAASRRRCGHEERWYEIRALGEPELQRSPTTTNLATVADRPRDYHSNTRRVRRAPSLRACEGTAQGGLRYFDGVDKRSDRLRRVASSWSVRVTFGTSRMTNAVLRVEKLKGKRVIVNAAKHNCREIAAERGAHSHIDSTRIALNYAIRGGMNSTDIAAQAANRMATLGIDAARLRKDAVRGIEFVFSPSRDAQLDHHAFFTACTNWVGERFGGEDNIVSSIVHLDEALPHCHVLIVPISGGRMVGSDMLGFGAHFASIKQEFQERVCVPHGLQPPPRKLWGAAKAVLAGAVIKALESNSDAAMRSTLWQSIREAVEREPEPFALEYGVAMPTLAPAKPSKSFVEIMTGKGKRTAEDRNPIGFARRENHQTLSCVGFAISPALSPPPNEPHRPRRYLLSECLQ
jgi:hypothetical protein